MADVILRPHSSTRPPTNDTSTGLDISPRGPCGMWMSSSNTEYNNNVSGMWINLSLHSIGQEIIYSLFDEHHLIVGIKRGLQTKEV